VTARQIFKGLARAEREVENLLQTIFAAELLAPSEILWIVSPWISDLDVLDNTTGAFAGLEPTWGRRRISLSEVLGALMRQGGGVVVATRTDDHNLRFVRRLEAAAESAGLRDRLLVVLDERERLHEKGLVGDDFFLSGSMNFTYNGIRLHDEAVRLELDDQVVADARLNFRQTYGVPTK
jgi:phosphatidylserine/phosphatidylglycerophosphate/cardiolipin synthase-like enzyme